MQYTMLYISAGLTIIFMSFYIFMIIKSSENKNHSSENNKKLGKQKNIPKFSILGKLAVTLFIIGVIGVIGWKYNQYFEPLVWIGVIFPFIFGIIDLFITNNKIERRIISLIVIIIFFFVNLILSFLSIGHGRPFRPRKWFSWRNREAEVVKGKNWSTLKE